jgi:hypothetical protein
MEDNYRDEMLIGEVLFKDIGLAKIWVFGKEEETIPHFHIINENTDIAMCIYKNAYINCHSKFNKKISEGDCKILNSWLSSIIDDLPIKINANNWEGLALTWDCCNGDAEYEPIQPHYSRHGMTVFDKLNPVHGRYEMLAGELQFKSIGLAKIWVFGDEGDIEPHFHIMNDEGINIAVHIFRNECLLQHSTMLKALYASDYEILNKWLNEDALYKQYKLNRNNWKNIATGWYCCNGLIDESDKPQPQYLINMLLLTEDGIN